LRTRRTIDCRRPSPPARPLTDDGRNDEEQQVTGHAAEGVGQPDPMIDLKRVQAVRDHLGPSVLLMVDANQQWDRPTAHRFGHILEQFNLAWIEEPLDAYDAEGHAALAAQLDMPIASGEMLTSVTEHWELIRNDAVDFIQPDAPRVGGITQFLKIAALADHKGLRLAPHFAMEIHLHLAAAYAREPWVEHFEWLEASSQRNKFAKRPFIRSLRCSSWIPAYPCPRRCVGCLRRSSRTCRGCGARVSRRDHSGSGSAANRPLK
jgi:L-alanine-DL-glutamate epimerase-like enolase superfamily enzyme